MDSQIESSSVNNENNEMEYMVDVSYGNAINSLSQASIKEGQGSPIDEKIKLYEKFFKATNNPLSEEYKRELPEQEAEALQ